MYYNKVVLGKEFIIDEKDKDSISAGQGYHSTHGKCSDKPNDIEYI
ncbi:unnamed protein product, partial [Rotaria magnacalcarata]